MDTSLLHLLSVRAAIKVKLMIFKKFMETTDLSSDSVAFEKRIQTNKNLYSQFDSIQKEIEIMTIGTKLEEMSAEERESFEAIYFGVISGAEKCLKDARMAQMSENDPGSSGAHKPCFLATEPGIIDDDLKKWFQLMLWEESGMKETDDVDVDEIAKLIQQRVEYLQELKAAKLAARSAMQMETPEHLRATSSSEFSHAIYSGEYSRYINSPGLSQATSSSEFSQGTSISEVSQAISISELPHAINSSEHSRYINSPELSYVTSSSELSHATSISELSHATNSSEHSRHTNSPELLLAINCSEFLRAIDSSEHSQAINNTELSHGIASHVVNRRCLLCQGEHVLHECPQLLAMTFPERHETIKGLRVCFNCLYFGHNVKDCKRSKCRKCGKKHHTVLHRESSINKEKAKSLQPQMSLIAQICSWNADNNECTVLSTAIVYVLDNAGNKQKCRVLLDVGSQSHIITEDFCNKLKLPLTPVDMTLGGIGSSMNSIRFKTQLCIISASNESIGDISCLVLKNITDKIPNFPLTMVNVPMPPGVIPADPHFQYPDTIDLLIGASLFWKLLSYGQYRVNRGNLIWQNTRLGWVLGGSFYQGNDEDEFM